MNRLLMYGSVLAATVTMCLPVHSSLLGLPVSCGTGWQALTATGDTGTVCNDAGLSRGYLALLIVVVGLVLAYIVSKLSDRRRHEEALLALLTSEQRLQYEDTIAEPPRTLGLGVKALIVFAVLVVVGLVSVLV